MWRPDKIIGAACGLGIINKSGSEKAPNALCTFVNFDTIVLTKKNQTILSYLLDLYQATLPAHLPLTFGGDHSVAIATWQAALQNYGDDFALLWFDAHLDANNFHTSPSGNYHGMPLAALLGHCKQLEFIDNFKYLKPENLYILGVRDYESQEYALLNKLGVKIYMMEDLKRNDIKQIIRTICNKHSRIGISFDCDSIDPKFLPAVNTPVTNGFKINELVSALQLTQHQLIGLEIVEYNPNLDPEKNAIDVIRKLFSWVKF